MELNDNGKRNDKKHIKNKKSVNITIFAGIILVCIGAIMAVSGFLMGADFDIYKDSTISATSVAVEVFDDNIEEASEITNSNLNLDEFKDIDIKLNSSGVEFIQSEKYGINASYFDRYINGMYIDDENYRYSIEYEVNNGVLKVYDNYQKILSKGILNDSFYDENMDRMGNVKIYIPSDTDIKNVNIDISGVKGNLNISNLNANYLNINHLTAEGDLRFSDSSVKNIDILCDISSYDNKNIVRNISTDNFNWTSNSGLNECTFENINTDLSAENLKSKSIKINTHGKLNIYNIYADRVEIEAENDRSDKIMIQNVNLPESYSTDINVRLADSLDVKDINSQNITYTGEYNNSKFDSIKADSFYVNLCGDNFKIFHSDIKNIDYISKIGDTGSENSEWNDVRSEFVSIDTNIDIKISNSTIDKLDIYNECANLVLTDVATKDRLNIKGEELKANLSGSFAGNTSIELVSGEVDFDTDISKSEYGYNLSAENSLNLNGDEIYENDEFHDGDNQYKQAAILNDANKSNNLKINVERGNIKVRFAN